MTERCECGGGGRDHDRSKRERLRCASQVSRDTESEGVNDVNKLQKAHRAECKCRGLEGGICLDVYSPEGGPRGHQLRDPWC